MTVTPRSERPGIASLGARLEHLPVLVAVPHHDDAVGAMSVAKAVECRYGSVVSIVRVAENADEIVHYARDHHAALIVMPLPTSPVDTPAQRDLVLDVARCTHVPVLAVANNLCGLPRRAVAGVDFTPTSTRAARAAVDLIARPVSRAAALLRLVHIDDRTATARAVRAGTSRMTGSGIEAAFDSLIRELEAPEYVRVDGVVRYGAVPAELLRLAAESEADLVVVGTRHYTRVGYSHNAGVTDDVLRDAKCSVLAVPPPY